MEKSKEFYQAERRQLKEAAMELSPEELEEHKRRYLEKISDLEMLVNIINEVSAGKVQEPLDIYEEV